MSSVKTVVRLLPVVAALTCTSAAAADVAPDPFYVNLLREGRTSLVRGDAASAAKELRVACFGLLEQPPLLGECLVRLALAQGALGDRAAFADTFDRLEVIQGRFEAYAKAAITGEERREFEGRVLDWISVDVLRTNPTFAPLLVRREEEMLAKLAPRERQKELERRATAEPGNPRWRVLLAADEIAKERYAPALDRLRGVAAEAEEGRAGCLSGLALARLERCREALVPLAGCAQCSSDPAYAEARLGCLLASGALDEGSRFVASLEPRAASAPAVRRLQEDLARRTEPKAPKGRAANEPPAAPRQSGPEVLPPDASPSGSATAKPPAGRGSTPAPAVRPTAEEEKALREARDLLRSAERREELIRGLASLRPVSDRHPGNAELALAIGEIAYRSGQWRAGADAFARAAPEGPTDPTLRFYMAVCLYEAGDRASAAMVAASGLERLQRTPFVDSYLRKIRGAVP